MNYQIYHAPITMMGSIQLRQAFPLKGLDQISPFILLHHFDFTITPGVNSFNVPAHPHRGFCPITFMFDGSVMHKDSLGNEAEIHSNEVQWINAGRGIIHSETMSPEFVAKGGRFQGIQLWINLPASQKMNPPSYQPITSNEIEIIEQSGSMCRLVSGTLQDKKGPAHANTLTAMLTMQPQGTFTFTIPEKQHTVIYVLEGEIELSNNQTVKKHQFVVIENNNATENQEIILKANETTKALLMSGEPIAEPLVTYGPFVMNSETEIMEAMRDYQMGKMGYLY